MSIGLLSANVKPRLSWGVSLSRPVLPPAVLGFHARVIVPIHRQIVGLLKHVHQLKNRSRFDASAIEVVFHCLDVGLVGLCELAREQVKLVDIRGFPRTANSIRTVRIHSR